jgi:hypothetical protein
MSDAVLAECPRAKVALSPALWITQFGRCSIAAILLCSAMLKLDQFVRLKAGLLISPAARGLLLPAVFIEFSAGAILIPGLGGRALRRLYMAAFLSLFCIASLKLLRHESSCGCFGDVHVPPLVTLIFDLSAATFFATVKTERYVWGTRRQRWAVFGIVLVLVSGVAAWRVWVVERAKEKGPRWEEASGKGQEASGEADYPGSVGSLMVLEPATWAGPPYRPWGLIRHIDIGPELSHGRWVVLLVHHDCDHCVAAVAAAKAASDKKQAASNVRLAVVEMPPYASASDLWPLTSDLSIAAGKLDTQRDWFATTPVAVLLEDGRVKSAVEGEAAEKPDGAWWR